MKHKKAVAWILAVVAVTSVAGYLVSVQGRRRSDRVYRIGWEEVPPYQIRGADGAPTGFAIELIKEAAQRRGIRLAWVWSPISSEAALRQNLVDLWPLMTVTPERKQFLHITEPYLQHDHYLIIQAASPYSQLRDLAHATIAYEDLPVQQRLVQRVLPGARMVARPTTKEAIEEVCRGGADATFVEESGGMSALLGGVECAGHPLRLIWIPSLQTRLGVGATFDAQGVADEIREEMAAMAPALPRIMERWGYYSPQNLETMNALLAARRVQRGLVYTIGFFALLFLAVATVANHIRRQANRIKREVAERELAERALREWERRFRDLLESAQVVAIIIDLDSGISFCNNYALSITGWTREEMIGHPAKEFLDAGYLRQLADATQHSSSNGNLLPLSESAILTRNREPRWIQWASTVLRDPGGRAVGFASLGEDVTELKHLRAQAAIRESEERFRAIFQQAAVGVAQIDLDGNVLLPNDRYCAILGMTREELVGKSFRNYTHPDDIEPQSEQIAGLLAGKIPSFSMEKRYLRKDGTVLWARVHGSLVRDCDGRPQHFIAVLEDITARKQAEAALRESEERFRNMADTAPVLIWVAGTDKRCTFFNKGWLDFTGRTMAEEIGDGWTAGVHTDDLERCWTIYSSAFDERRQFQMEYRLRSADGTFRWIRDEGVPRVGPDGAFAGYIGSCVDVTDLKRAHEEALERQKLETVGVLAGGIAHDFNNLLGSIMADSELALAELPCGSPARVGLARIGAVALRAAEIVRELLAYAGKETAVFEPVDLSALVGEMLHLLKVSISKQAVLKVHLPANMPAVRANAAQLRQVVMNLVTNASESLGPEGGIITVVTSGMRISPDSPAGPDSNLPEGDYVRLLVGDTGCGMTGDVQARIFDPYFTTKFAGRGLGLAAVQGIIRGHGGAIQMASTPGQGTRFEILLPAVHEPVSAARIAAGPSEERPEQAAGTVLIVEDESSLRTPVATLLRRKGYRVIEAGDGAAALGVFRNGSAADVDVVLLDMTLPGMSGAEVFLELRQARPEVKVVLTTAYSQETVLTALGGLEAWGFIRKPYQIAELASLLQSACLAPRAGCLPSASGS